MSEGGPSSDGGSEGLSMNSGDEGPPGEEKELVREAAGLQRVLGGGPPSEAQAGAPTSLDMKGAPP